MIYCIIDGDMVYPSLSSNIKITKENNELKDKGSYTLDVTFPLSIYENRMKFGSINRMDASVKKNKFENVSLHVGRTEVIKGVGVINSVNNDEIKLQIMDSNSEFKYVSGFDKIYLDELLKNEYNALIGLPGNPPIYYPGGLVLLNNQFIDYDNATASQKHVGNKSVGIYTPIYDETSSEVVNEIAISKDDGKLIMIRPTYQPNLLYIMRKAFEKMGYTADLSLVDVFPWNNIYIVNTGAHLPHWTLERFISEFKNFFAVNLKIDGKTAVFGRISAERNAVSYECVDDFTVEYDDEGIQSNSTNNIKYNLYDCEEKTFYTEIPEDVMNTFKLSEYSSESEMMIAFNGMEYKEKMQTIFSTPTGYYYARSYENDSTITLARCGQFNPLVRDKDNDNYEELAIVPVNMVKKTIPFRRVRFENTHLIAADVITDKQEDIDIIMPVSSGEDISSDIYGTVQQALEEGETSDGERSETERMEVFFLGSSTKSFNAIDKTVTLATVGTDQTIDADFKDSISFALDKKPSSVTYVGKLHNGNSRIDGKNQRCIKFISDDIPDPTDIFMFNGKRYVCEKLEIQITDTGIDKLKTGYFYEIVL